MRCLLPALTCVLLVTGGCGLELTKEEGQRRSADSGVGGIASGNLLDSPAPRDPPESQPPAESPPPAEQPADTPPAEQAAETGKAPPNTTAAADQVTVGARSTDPNTSASVANRKLVKKGQYTQSGMVITPIKAYFRTQARTELEFKVPQAVQLYQAEHGHFPKTPEDFMKDIIEAQKIKLPELPPGHRYAYDPETGELLIEHPAK